MPRAFSARGMGVQHERSNIEAGKFELSAHPFDPREAIAELTELLSERGANKGIEFAYYVAEDVPSQR
jgi:two-component system, NarL family, sensor histidine kinase BarA